MNPGSVDVSAGTVAALFDQLDEIAARDTSGTVVHLAVWAARAAASDGDMVAAERWAEHAAHESGRLF